MKAGLPLSYESLFVMLTKPVPACIKPGAGIQAPFPDSGQQHAGMTVGRSRRLSLVAVAERHTFCASHPGNELPGPPDLQPPAFSL